MNKPFYTNVRQWGNDLLYIGYNSKGEKVQKKIPFSPDIYVNTDDENIASSSSYDGTLLKKVLHPTIKDAKEFIKTYNGCNGISLYGMDQFQYQFINRTFTDEIPYDIDAINTQIIDIEVMSDDGFPDPELAEKEITCMSLKDMQKNEMHVWAITNTYGGQNFDPHNLKYIPKEELTFDIILHEFSTEKDMLRDFAIHFHAHCPDILTGWYSRHFDVPYIYNRLKNVLGIKYAKKLSPWNKVNTKTKTVWKFGKEVEETTYDIFGLAELDYLDLYQKYSFGNQPNYKLDYIANKHLGVGKLEFKGTLHDLLMSDYQKYLEYNIIDVERISQLDNALKFLDLIIDVSYSGKVATYNDSLGTVKYWEMLIYSHLLSKGQQPPLKKNNQNVKKDQYAGAFVKEPVKGKHKWIVSFDLASLYPSIIRQVNIGPETKIDQRFLAQDTIEKIENLPLDRIPDSDKYTANQKYIDGTADLSFLKDYSLAANGVLYSKDHQSFLSELMEKFFNKRKVYKKKMFEAAHLYNDTGLAKYKKEKLVYGIKQLATKISINSAYGAIGNAYFPYYDLDNAEAITITGQMVIRWIEKRMNEYLCSLMGDDKDRITYIDTDSIYITLDDLVQKVMPEETDEDKITTFLDTVAKKKLEPFINKSFDELFTYMNNYENHMVMDREIISNVAVWTGKKRYFMNVQDNEGVRYSPAEFKVMGLESVKSSTPLICRKKLDECLRIILNKDEEDLIAFVSAFKKEFYSLPPEDISFPSGTNDIEKWMDGNRIRSGCPIHVRGAIIHNQQVIKHSLTNRYSLISSGDKVLYTYMKMPNTLHQKVFAFVDEMPEELNLKKYVDYDLQFEKTFLAPLKGITDILKWKTEETNDLFSMFR